MSHHYQKSDLSSSCRYCSRLRYDFLTSLLREKLESRDVDNSNNNQKHPNYGKTGQPFRRAAPPEYGDGLNSPAGSDRPSPRVISNEIFDQDKSNPDSDGVTNIFWLWGQFVDHTITRTDTGEENLPISVPKGDIYFDPNETGEVTIDFHRSTYVSNEGTPREQVNQLSPFLDGSMVYGHNKERNDYLREFKGGRMRTSQGKMLPFDDGHLRNDGHSRFGAFIAGDIRVNEHIGLASIHNLFVLEHNYWAGKISKCRPNISDEEIYQCAKMIVEAEIQAITFNEFLPILLGKNNMSSYQDYDQEVNPQLVNEFSAATYRFGHSMVSSSMYGQQYQLRDTFFSSHLVCNNGGMSPILRQFCITPAETLDAKMIHDLRNFLFGKPGQGGHDLTALNIQRGRDHGLANYNQVRKSLGLSKLDSFEDLSDGSSDLQEKLKLLYGSPDKMDLFVGGLLEKKMPGAQVGETVHHIIKDQFQRIRSGDRFWYQNRMNSYQIEYIQGITLGQIIYRHTGKNQGKNQSKDRGCSHVAKCKNKTNRKNEKKGCSKKQSKKRHSKKKKIQPNYHDVFHMPV